MERRDTLHFGVQLRTSSPKGSCICSPASAKQPLIQRKNHSPTRIGGRHRSVPGTLKVRTLTYIGTTKCAPSGQPEAVVRPAVAHRFAQGLRPWQGHYGRPDALRREESASGSPTSPVHPW